MNTLVSEAELLLLLIKRQLGTAWKENKEAELISLRSKKLPAPKKKWTKA